MVDATGTIILAATATAMQIQALAAVQPKLFGATGYHMPMAPASLRAGVNGGRPADNIVHVGTACNRCAWFYKQGKCGEPRSRDQLQRDQG